MSRRVVVTGIGVVSPFGYSVNALMDGIRSRKSAVRKMDEWPMLKGLNSRLGATLDMRDEKNIPRKFRRSMSKMSVFAVQAAEEALDCSGIDRNILTSGNVGCILGSTTGSPHAIQEAFEKVICDKDISVLTSMSFFKGMSHTVTSNVALYFGITGAVYATSSACASSLQAICMGYDMIKNGRQDLMICGGAEELHPAVTASFDILEATSINFMDKPYKTPRPFDKDRDGLVCGEGAGVLILEDYDSAKLRGAKILCEIAGYNTNTSPVTITQSDKDSLSACMKKALKDAKIAHSEIDYINAHATGTVQGDKAEAEAIYDVFGNTTPVSGLKGFIGHTLGASGAIESAAVISMMQENTIYPGLNLDNIAEDCNMVNLFREKQSLPINIILKNAFAFGGINVSIIYRRCV